MSTTLEKRKADKPRKGEKPGKSEKPKGKKKPTLADKADKYKLYQKSVQEPGHEVEFFDQAYEEEFGKKPVVLREDFCGTFAVCCEWAKLAGRTAYGVDLDPEPLTWGREHNLSKLKPSQQERVTLVQDDVRSNGTPKAHVLAAQNFSFWYFKTREELLNYFKFAHQNLADEGMMIMDMMGGGDCITDDQSDVRKVGSFKYIWEQHSYDPITHDASFYIHFKFKDGSKLKRAFEYHWRFWTIPEVRELLQEAGFSASHVYWEGVDKDGEGDDDWKRTKHASSDPCWLAYIVALK
ncbi:MAG: hypothetical protein R3C45_14085 [Phycisphaerales bacterium]